MPQGAGPFFLAGPWLVRVPGTTPLRVPTRCAAVGAPHHHTTTPPHHHTTTPPHHHGDGRRSRHVGRADPTSRWLVELRAGVGWQKACGAMANKNARILWAVMARGQGFDVEHVSVKPPGKWAKARKRASCRRLPLSSNVRQRRHHRALLQQKQRL